MRYNYKWCWVFGLAESYGKRFFLFATFTFLITVGDLIQLVLWKLIETIEFCNVKVRKSFCFVRNIIKSPAIQIFLVSKKQSLSGYDWFATVIKKRSTQRDPRQFFYDVNFSPIIFLIYQKCVNVGNCGNVAGFVLWKFHCHLNHFSRYKWVNRMERVKRINDWMAAFWHAFN